MKRINEGRLNEIFQKRLEENLNEFVRNILLKSEEEIIAMNKKMAVVEYVYDRLIHHKYFSDDTIEIFLMFHSPLMIISDIVLKDWNGKSIATNHFDAIVSEFIEQHAKYFNEYLLESYCCAENKQENKDNERKFSTEDAKEKSKDLTSLLVKYAVASFKLFLEISEYKNGGCKMTKNDTDSNVEKAMLEGILFEEYSTYGNPIYDYIKGEKAKGLTLVYDSHSEQWELVKENMYTVASCTENEDGEIPNWFLKEVLCTLDINDLWILAYGIDSTV